MRALLWLALVGCGGRTVSDSGELADPCAGSLAPGEVRVLAEDFVRNGTTGTEGVAFSPDGRLFVGGSGLDAGNGFVAEVQPDGSWSVVADVPQSVGLAWADDRLLVATTDVGDGTAGVVSVDVDAGTTEVFVGGMEGSNFLAVTPWGSLLVSSPGGDAIWEVRDGAVSTWVDGLASPNGIAFDAEGTTTFVANTYGSPSDVVAIDVVGTSAGEVRVLATLPDGSTQDGVAMDAQGRLYVVNNLPGTIAGVDADGSWEVVAEGVDFGASLAFGEGSWDRCSVVATSLFSPRLVQVGLGVSGASPWTTLAR